MSDQRGAGRGGGRGVGRGRGRGQFEVPFHSRGGRGGASQESGRGRGGGGDGPRPDFTGGFRGRGSFDQGRGDRGGRGGRGRGGGAGRAPPAAFSHGPNVPAKQPDAKVTEIENATEKNVKATQPAGKAPALSPSMPPRPGFGTQGSAFTLYTNYFALALKDNGDRPLFRYSIEIKPPQGKREPAGKKSKRLVELLIEEHFPQFRNQLVTDFRSNAVCTEKLQLQDSYPVRHKMEGEDEPPSNANTYLIRLQLTGTLSVADLLKYLCSPQASQALQSKEEVIQALNVILGHSPKASRDIASIGANRHYNHPHVPGTETGDLGAGLKAIRGFFVSVRPATGRILVNVQVKNGAFYDNGPLDKLMMAFFGENGPNKQKLKVFLNKLSINVKHIVKKNKSGQPIMRIKTIQGLAHPGDGRQLEHPPRVAGFGAGARAVEFWLEKPGPGAGPSTVPGAAASSSGGGKKGKKPPKAGPSAPGHYISVYDFFKEVYNITVEDPNLPVINVGTAQNPSYLPAQVCDVVPGQPSRAKLSPWQTAQMINFAVRRPHQNAESVVREGAKMLGFAQSNSVLQAYGISVKPELLTVPARQLKGPVIKYANNKSVNIRAGSWNMMSIVFSQKSVLDYWTVLWIRKEGGRAPWGTLNEVKPTVMAFKSKLNEVGVVASEPIAPADIQVPDIHPKASPAEKDQAQRDVEEIIDKTIFRFMHSTMRKPPKFLLVILPSDDSIIYNAVKTVCDVKYGLPNVNVVAAKFAKNDPQYFANVALKVNLKLGGRNQQLESPKLGLLSEGKTMVVGIDVTHPSPGSKSTAPSVAGIVASVDKFFSQWPAALSVQQGRKEMVNDLAELFDTRLTLWKEKNGTLPENILVYRDGVSEGQYDLVLEHELKALRNACAKRYKSQPKITIIVVGKRHNTRFYPTKMEDADERTGNPRNGTVVDRGVTEARNWDFFLQAHTAIQGTARPAHYYIIYDEIFRQRAVQAPFKNAADALEDLTHNLCYMYGRATKAVSICPPAYYADLVCERARCYLSRFFDGDTPATSVTGGSSENAQQSDVRIHPNLKNTMFYI